MSFEPVKPKPCLFVRVKRVAEWQAAGLYLEWLRHYPLRRCLRG